MRIRPRKLTLLLIDDNDDGDGEEEDDNSKESKKKQSICSGDSHFVRLQKTTFEVSRRKEKGIRKSGLAITCTGLPP
jgi:hypothetical protein